MRVPSFPFKDEDAFHIAVAILLRKELRPGVIWFHPPNGELRDIVIAMKLKEMGVRPGVADFLIFAPGGVDLALELKTPKGRLSDNQKGFRGAWEASGRIFEVARSLDEMRAVLRKHGLLKQ